MIPQKLQLKNFLSYHQASLDFTGLHTACICGPNGAGKSSLLEAIAWAIWGNSRAATEDDIISLGEKEVRVDFTFSTHGNIYRVIRGRRRGCGLPRPCLGCRRRPRRCRRRHGCFGGCRHRSLP